jgi:NADPH:quinone reductase-like Zn-dependent oxidoreductase
MKAILWTRYGSPDGLQLQEIAKPAPRDNEVLIKNHAATVTLGDCEFRSLKTPIWLRLPLRLYVGVWKPTRITILGQELAGVIEAVGAQVTRFKPGDAVFAPCLLRLGAYAGYTCLPESYPVLKPAGMSFEQAATIPTGGINGLHFLKTAHIQPGERVLINGAGGSIGTYAVQIAKSLGAEVTGVDSAAKLSMLRSIGADQVIDYQQEDFTKRGETYDVIIDVVGKSSFSGSIRALKPNGRYILGNPTPMAMFRRRWTPMSSGKKVIVALANYKPEDYATLLGLFEAGKIKAVIDRRYPLEQTAEAHAYVDAGHKKGNVIITIAQDDPA